MQKVPPWASLMASWLLTLCIRVWKTELTKVDWVGLVDVQTSTFDSIIFPFLMSFY